jgi:hypothetical protein
LDFTFFVMGYPQRAPPGKLKKNKRVIFDNAMTRAL